MKKKYSNYEDIIEFIIVYNINKILNRKLISFGLIILSQLDQILIITII